MLTRIRLLLLLILLSSNIWASDNLVNWYTQDIHQKAIINVELFLSSTCPNCHKADAFFQELESKIPWMKVHRYIINDDKNALIQFNKLLNEQNMNDFAVPSAFFCNSRWVGFVSAETTGKELASALHYCKEQIDKEGALSNTAVTVLKRQANANLFNANMYGHPTAASFITVLALADAFNPCALFCLLCFFAFLFIQQTARQCLIIGGLFIGSVALVHYLQQVNTNAFFSWLPWLRWPAVLTGLLTIYALNQHYRMRSINSLLLFLVPVLAFMLQSYQQTCLMSWSSIFEQWLNTQQITHNQAVIYQSVYQIIYILPISLTLILYATLIKKKPLNNLKPFLNNLGMLFILLINALLIINPVLLSNFVLSLFVLVFSIGSVWVLHRYKIPG